MPSSLGALFERDFVSTADEPDGQARQFITKQQVNAYLYTTSATESTKIARLVSFDLMDEEILDAHRHMKCLLLLLLPLMVLLVLNSACDYFCWY
jgi:hypothetical protein